MRGVCGYNGPGNKPTQRDEEAVERLLPLGKTNALPPLNSLPGDVRVTWTKSWGLSTPPLLVSGRPCWREGQQWSGETALQAKAHSATPTLSPKPFRGQCVDSVPVCVCVCVCKGVHWELVRERKGKGVWGTLRGPRLSPVHGHSSLRSGSGLKLSR